MSAQAACAATSVERGSYLVNTIMACGNCHTPRDANGAFVSGKAFSGGLTITTPAFAATAPNITQDRDTGIGDWSDAEIKRALIEGVRPDHGHLGGVTLAAVMPASFYKALLPEDLDAIVAYLRTVKAVRNTVPEPEYKMPYTDRPIPTPKRDSPNPSSPIPSGMAPISSPSAIAWNVTRPGRPASPTSRMVWGTVGDRSGRQS
jgi:mono/diheme cytochrome c family protein